MTTRPPCRTAPSEPASSSLISRNSSAPAALSAARPGAISIRDGHCRIRPMTKLTFEVPVLQEGDVNARVWIRIREVEQSLALIEQILAGLPGGAMRTEMPHRAGEGMAMVEGFRGDILAWVRLDGRRPHRALPFARSVLVSMAAAGSRHRGKHRRRLSALQQILQLLLFRMRSLKAFRCASFCFKD